MSVVITYVSFLQRDQVLVLHLMGMVVVPLMVVKGVVDPPSMKYHQPMGHFRAQ